MSKICDLYAQGRQHVSGMASGGTAGPPYRYGVHGMARSITAKIGLPVLKTGA